MSEAEYYGELFYIEQVKQQARLDEFRELYTMEVKGLSDSGLTRSIIDKPAMTLNYIVRDGKFPAWDIACRMEHRKLTEKQRTALENVLIYYLSMNALAKELGIEGELCNDSGTKQSCNG